MNKYLPTLIGSGVVIIAFVFLSSCGKGDYEKQLSACIDRGVESYKSFGAYPKLPSGRDTVDEVANRCKRNTGIFPKIGKP